MVDKPAFLLKTGAGDPLVYTTVAGLRVTSMSLGAGNAEITGTGIFTGSNAETNVQKRALSGEADDYELSFDYGERLRGKFLITRLSYAGDSMGERTYTISLSSVDARFVP